MSSKGGSSHLNRLSAPRAMRIARKENVWIKKPSPGPHPLERSLPISVVLRDVLQVANDARESAMLLRQGDVFVDGRVVKKPGFPVGLMDIVTIPKAKLVFLVTIDEKARVVLKPLDAAKSATKLCQVQGKRTVSKGLTQLTFHDGRTLLTKENVKTGSTALFSIKEKKISSVLPLEVGAHVLVASGKHAGTRGVVKSLTPGTATRDAEAEVEADGEKFGTVTKYLFVVGDAL